MFSELLRAIFKGKQHAGVRKVTCRVVLALSWKLNALSTFDLMETLQSLIVDYGNKTILNVAPTRRNDILKGIEEYIKGYVAIEVVVIAGDTSTEDLVISGQKFDGVLCREEMRKTCTINKNGFVISDLLSIEYDIIYSITVKNSTNIIIETKAPIKNLKTSENQTYATVAFRSKSEINIDKLKNRAAGKVSVVNDIHKKKSQKRKRSECTTSSSSDSTTVQKEIEDSNAIPIPNIGSPAQQAAKIKNKNKSKKKKRETAATSNPSYKRNTSIRYGNSV